MAAYASLVILAKNIDPVHGDLNHIHHDLDLKPLYEKVVQLQAIMENCPGETLSQEFQAKIRDFGYRANRVIDTHYLQVLRWKRGEGCVGYPKFDELTDDAASLILEAGNLGAAVATTTDLIMQMQELSLAPSSSSSVYTPGGATRKLRLYSDVAKLKDKLYAGSSQKEVIPIVGIGGSGKTTIASFLYQDSGSERWFDRRAWITVSQNYDKCTLLSQILKSLNESAPETYDYLGEKVHQTLKWRRYLLVIDDVWSHELWDDINIFLPDDENGSRILLTTRLVNVADYVVTGSSESYIHRSELLDLNSSWSLLKDTAFGQDGDCPVELEEIGKSIAKDCAGLPLAIVVIGGVLSSTNNKKDLWEKIAANVKTSINTSSSNRVAKALSLSYINLPHHLKPCFLYLACFPEDYDICVSKLMKLWAAEGFLKVSKFEMSEEEVAYEYLEDLIKRNLVLVSETEYNGKIEKCRLHDMIRDLSVETSAKENFLMQVHKNCELSSKDSNDLIRFSVNPMTSFSHVQQLPATNVRSALCILQPFWGINKPGLLLFMMRFRLLRVLDIRSVLLPEFPDQVCQLFLLRYLDIRVHSYEPTPTRLPSSIKKLQCLQVLHLSGNFFELPLEIWEMSKLRHLIVEAGMRLPDPPIGTRSSSSPSSLENLKTLGEVSHFKCTKQVLQMIPNIKSLIIKLEDYGLWNLVPFANLETLIISSNFSLIYIKLPRSLKKLCLFNCCFPWSEVGTVAGSLPNLEIMVLENHYYAGDVWEVKEGEFSKLKVLVISNAHFVIWKYDGDDRYIFPSLEELHLSRLERLTEFPWCIGEIYTLRLIGVDECSELLVNWAREVEEKQKSYGNEYLQGIDFAEFPYQVCQLFLLRYLAINVDGAILMKNLEVPSCIKELQCLQVLSIGNVTLEPPFEIWEMPKLRHVLGYYSIMLPDPPIGTRSSSSPSSLENPQTLDHLSDFKFTEHVLHMIPNLQYLFILYKKNHYDVCFQNLVLLGKLETLRISCGKPRMNIHNIKMPLSLKELTLLGCIFPWSELGTIVGSLPNLEVMNLAFNQCVGNVWEVKEGEFPKLKVLKISHRDLVIWNMTAM